MLQITIPPVEAYDDKKEEFVVLEKEQTLQLEHSLVSISKWESKWCKPFLSNATKSIEETVDYIKCMTLTKNIRPEVYDRITDSHIRQVNSYIEAPMTATTIRQDKKSKNNRIMTAELLYYYMFAFNIPMECQKWHLNRLITLIKVCEAESNPKKNRSQDEIRADYAALNAARRKALNSKG